MGLSAAQARLLTITARKSDCEFRSMGFSHEKIALSREMTDISNEYQDSLNLTKMVYDFYGNGDTSTPLSYNILMTPSQYNGYMPMLTTDTSGRVLLDSRYAAAAAAAGIPKEGLNSLPSAEVRNKFLYGLAEAGYMTQEEAKVYSGVEYSPDMGLGSTDLITTSTKEIGWEDFYEMFEDLDFSFDCHVDSSNFPGDGNSEFKGSHMSIDGENKGSLSTWVGNGGSISMKDLLEKDYSVSGVQWDSHGDDARFQNVACGLSHMNGWEQMFAAFRQVLGGSSINDQALDYAEAKIRGMLYFQDEDYNTYDGEVMQGELIKPNTNSTACDGWGQYLTYYHGASKASVDEVNRTLIPNLRNYIGYVGYDIRRGPALNQKDGVGISISNIARAFLTYFVQYVDGLTSDFTITHDDGVKIYGNKSGSERYEGFDGEERSIFNNDLIDPSKAQDFKFTVTLDTGINTNQALISGFYDALFNQICLNGWVENDKVNDNDYLQEMYKNGMLFLTTCSTDGFYYQENWGTNTYIKEVTDDEAIARAEAKYNTQKQKLSQKEEIIDMKMKNLDTEISSLTTEYDTVKSLISKNIERGFKRYEA